MKNDKILQAILYSPGIAHSIKIAIEMGIFDELYNGPTTGAELALKKNLNVDALKRFLNFLSNLGLVYQTPSLGYSLTDIGERFTSTSLNSIFKETLLLLSQEIEMAWSDLRYSLKSGKPAFDNLFGVTFKEYLDIKRGRRLLFHAGWEEASKKVAKELLSHFSFRGISSIAEVGGREGTLLSKLLQHNPQMTGYLYETISLKGKAKKKFSEYGVANRAYFREANSPLFLTDHPELVILKSYLHLFPNEEAREVLKSCLSSLPSNGRILVVERALCDDGFLDRATFTDMIMLLMTGGRERTLKEMKELFSESGFSLKQTKKMDSGFCIFEGVPL